VRCEQHALACGPDGRCVLCRKREASEPGRGQFRLVGLVGLGAALVLVAAAAAVYRVSSLRRAMADSAAGPRGTAATNPIEVSTVDAPPAPTVTPIDPPVVNAAEDPAPTWPAPTPSPTAEPPVKLRPESAATVSIADVPVVVYTTSWCPVCRRAKAWMASRGIAYEDRDIESSRENAVLVRTLNPRGSIPTFDIDGDVMIGFSESNLVAMMQRAARRRAAREFP
jgi:glutaredoxin